MKKIIAMFVMVMAVMSLLAGCGGSKDTFPEGRYRLHIDGVDKIYYVTFTAKGERTAYVEYPDGTVEESPLLMHSKVGRVSFVFNGSRDEWKYNKKNDEWKNVNGTAIMIKTLDQNSQEGSESQ